MTVSTCIKCEEHTFELALFTPLGQSHKLTMVQCASCGTPVGAIDPASRLLMEELKAKIDAIDQGLIRIAKAI